MTPYLSDEVELILTSSLDEWQICKLYNKNLGIPQHSDLFV